MHKPHLGHTSVWSFQTFFTASFHISKPVLFYQIPLAQLHPLSRCVPKWFSSLFSLLRNERQPHFCHEISLCCLLFCCFVSFSLISLPGQENVQMFIHRPHCVEASRVSQIIALMFLYGSMSKTAGRGGFWLLTVKAVLILEIKASGKCHRLQLAQKMELLRWHGNFTKLFL